MAASGDFMAGTLRVLILSELSRAPGHGYGIAKAIDAAAGGTLRTRPESLYPVLHRLEHEGLVEAQWEEAAGRPRKVYQLTERGRGRWETLRADFVRTASAALRAIGESPADNPAEIPA